MSKAKSELRYVYELTIRVAPGQYECELYRPHTASLDEVANAVANAIEENTDSAVRKFKITRAAEIDSEPVRE